MKLSSTINGVKFYYYGYCYSDESGTVQFITMTSKNLMDKYKKEFKLLVNGLVKS